ncbi:putative ferric-chelate reductase 1 [Chionoecetes opilio]|uniref:Putative ferric-chelate reductase 1 n=1 Tax=Chionoecetes opilio TaxID=41210 RepID=A0A8J4YF61_CHIOP|nr:putative ferric-chelate reductase 1 [Chionoecetes opilio]
MLIVGLVVVLVAAWGVMGHPTGAPSSVCDHPFMEPICHRDNLSAIGFNNTGQYSLCSDAVEGSPGRVMVTLTGASFKGFVIRATTDGENLGEFNEEGSNVSFNDLTCSRQEDVAVTHVNANSKSSVSLVWEESNGGKSTFQATVVPSIETYVINIYGRSNC